MALAPPRRRPALRIALLGCLAPVARGHCRGLDRSALINLYEALDGANWTNNKNWNVTSGTPAENKANDPCSIEKRWFGVGFMDPCEKYLDDIVGWGPQTDYLAQVRGSGQGCFAGRVTSLNLHRNGLRGNLTTTIGDLTNLTYLDLSWNEVEGYVPSQIGLINNVQVINFNNNLFSGTLPSELGTINAAGPPESTGCDIDDPCPEGVQMKMNDLHLNDNAISGSIPSQLGILSHLRILDFSNNRLSGEVPAQLGNLTELQLFYLRHNALNGTLPPSLWAEMPFLRYVRFEHNSFEGALPSEVGLLQELNELHMHSNRLDHPLPEELGELPILRILQLQDNRINGSIPASIGKLQALQTLDLYNNRMTGDVPPAIKQLINIEVLYLQNEHLTPVRQRFCRQRLPNVGKYNWRVMREEYDMFTSVLCPDMHDVEFTFNALQASSSYDAAS